MPVAAAGNDGMHMLKPFRLDAAIVSLVQNFCSHPVTTFLNRAW